MHTHAHVSEDGAFLAFERAIFLGLSDRDSVKVGKLLSTPREHPDLCQTLENNTWITTFVKPLLERLNDKQLNCLIQDITIHFEYRLVALIVNGEIAKYLKDHPSEWRSAVETKHKQLNLSVEWKKTDNQIPLYQLAIDSALIRFAGYTHGKVATATAIPAKSSATVGTEPAGHAHTAAATDPASTGDADDPKKDEAADLEVATTDEILKPTDTAPTSQTIDEAVGAKRDASTTVATCGLKRPKLAVVRVTATLVDSDVDEPQVGLKRTAVKARVVPVPDEIPEVLDENHAVMQVFNKICDLLNRDVCAEVLLQWKELEKEADGLCALDGTDERLAGLAHRIASVVDALDVRFADLTIEFKRTHQKRSFFIAQFAFCVDPATGYVRTPEMARTALRAYTQDRVDGTVDWAAIRAKR